MVTEAPVFSKLPRLPTLLGQFVHTAPLFWALPLEVSRAHGYIHGVNSAGRHNCGTPVPIPHPAM